MENFILKNLGYFAFRSFDGEYISLFPSEKTKAGTISDRVTPMFVFERPLPTENQLCNQLQALADNFIPFSDFYWFMKQKTKNPVDNTLSYSSTEIIHWLGGLYCDTTDATITSTHIKCLLKSVADPSFSLTVYKTMDPSPQEAIDTIPLCQTPDGNFKVVLGRRASNPPVGVEFSGTRFTDSYSVKIQNKAGYILFGEHLLAEKKNQINNLYVSFLAGDKPYLEISTQDASEALRAVYEEGGLEFGGQIKAYMLAKDCEPGRDIRYWEYSQTNWETNGTGKYGFKRDSEAFTVLLIVPTIDTLPEPIDTLECQKGDILSETVALNDFRVGGKYDPVFPCHVRQLHNALDVAHRYIW